MHHFLLSRVLGKVLKENEEDVEVEQLCSSGFSTMPPPLKIAAETMVRHKTDMIKIIKICQSGTNTCLKELLQKHKDKMKIQRQKLGEPSEVVKVSGFGRWLMPRQHTKTADGADTWR